MKNADISARRDASISQAVGVMTQIYVNRAENSEVWGVEGNRTVATGAYRDLHQYQKVLYIRSFCISCAKGARPDHPPSLHCD